MIKMTYHGLNLSESMIAPDRDTLLMDELVYFP